MWCSVSRLEEGLEAGIDGVQSSKIAVAEQDDNVTG
jgi:hypothetical protein